MKKRKLAVWAGIGLALTTALSPLAVQAQSYNGSSIYKVTRSNGSPQVIVANRTPGERISITYPDATSTRKVTANACGLITLRDSSSNALADLVSVDGEAVVRLKERWNPCERAFSRMLSCSISMVPSFNFHLRTDNWRIATECRQSLDIAW